MKTNHSLDSEVNSNKIKKPKLGVVLREADIISDHQIKMALEYQSQFPAFRLGEILSIKGWTDPRTCDFFASKWHKLVALECRRPLGYYLLESGLLQKVEIEKILFDQKSQQYRFGTIAVMKGYIKPSTRDFFLKYLFPEELDSSSVRTLDSLLRSKQRQYKYYAEVAKRSKSSKIKS